LGRWFTDDEDQGGGEPVAVISDGLWRRRFQATVAVLGATVQVDGQPFTVVGVAPPAFSEIWRPEIWIPLGRDADTANRGNNYLLTFGRLRAGTTLASARVSLGELAAQMTREHPEDTYTFTARELHDVVTEGATRGLWVLLGATVLLLAIACTNVANLLLARAVVRERDLAVRASLGASRGQLFGQVMGETVALGLLGGVAGLALSWGLLRVFVAMAPANFPRIAAIGLDLRVLGFAVGAAVVAGLVAATAPPVVVVNDTLAARLWPGRPLQEAVGLQLRAEALDRVGVLREVVGVVSGVRSRRPDMPPDPEVHAPFAQLPVASMSYVVRADGDPARLTPLVRAALTDMSREVAMAAVRTFDDVITTATRTSGLLSWLSVLFGVLAAALAVVGIYGVMSYTVAQREHELAIRAAVGATRPPLLALVLREGLAMSAAAAAGLAAVTLAGYLIPATRASDVQPVVALRAE
jgi:cell division protein FtsX